MAVIIEAGDTFQDGSNTTSSTLGITVPNYSEGDLVIICIGIWQDNNDDTDVSWPSGPEGETVTSIETGYGGSGNLDLPMIAIGWFIGAAGGHTSANWDVTTNNATRFDMAGVIVPAGEFNVSNPISSAIGQDFDTTDDSTPTMPAFSANANDADGKLLAFIAVDQDPISGTPTGWTDFQDHDQGRMSIVLSGRDSAVTASESISSASWSIAGDAWTTYGFIVRPPGTEVNDERDAILTGIGSANDERIPRLYAEPSGYTGSHADNFLTTTNKDSGNTTANWPGDGTIDYP